MTPTQNEIQKHIDRLDEVSRAYEAEWGVGRLPHCVDGEMAAKWQRQWGRMNEAILKEDLFAVKDLAEGCIRAWKAMADNAGQHGYAPVSDRYWECQHPETGRVYRFWRNNTDCRSVRDEPGVSNWTLSEAVRLLESRGQLVSKVKETFPGATVTGARDMDWENGDEIPF